MSVELKIIESDKFCKMIEDRAANGQMSYIDAIVRVCDETGIEIESVNKLITPRIRKSIRTEATTLNLLKRKRGARLPV